MKKNNVITIEEDVRIPGTDILLEKGDRIDVLSEASATLEGKTIISVKHFGETMRVTLNDGASFDIYDWAWYEY